MEWLAILDYIKTLAPWASYVFIGLGSLTVIGTAVDSVIPDEKDGGFMKKLMAMPVLGSLLQDLAKFSPFNYKP